jgi:hypothetical protein
MDFEQLVANLNTALFNCCQVQGLNYELEMKFKEEVVAAMQGIIALQTGTVEDNSPNLEALQAENAQLSAKVDAGQKALEALDSILHPATIAPTTP